MTPKIWIIRQPECHRMPWKNGLGETLEIHKNEDSQGVRFRISQATVIENGVFSDFSGLDRHLVLLSGQGITLSHKNAQGNGYEHNLTSALDIARFAGGDTTHAKLVKGPIEALNIMVRKGDTKAKITACFAPYNLLVTPEKDHLLQAFYSNQACKIQSHEAEEWTLEANSFWLMKPRQTFQLITGCGVLIDITAK